MNPDPASLDNLRDIAEPPAVPWYPFAPGWWVLLGIAVVAGLYFGIRAWLNWKRNAYRRAALAELEGGGDVAKASEILKRTALVAFPRTKVAALTGSAWCAWLEEMGAVSMPETVREEFAQGVYGNPGGECSLEVLEYSRSWISGHRVEEEGGKAC